MTEMSVSHGGVVASYNALMSSSQFGIRLEKSTVFIHDDKPSKAVERFRKCIIPEETGERFLEEIGKMLSRLAPVAGLASLPMSFSVWEKDFPGGPMSIYVETKSLDCFSMAFNWDYGVKPCRKYDLLMVDKGDRKELFMRVAMQAAHKYREAVLLWKDSMAESLGIVSDSLNLIVGDQEIDHIQEAVEEK